MNSALYECHLLHHRLHPREHRFTNRIFFFALDLDELDALSRRLRLFSRNRPNFYQFRDADHLPSEEESAESPAPSLKEKVNRYLRHKGVAVEAARVVLVTIPRVAGYLFNPVSIYYCYDADGEALCAIAEVTNTFREVKPYLLAPESKDHARFRLRVPKLFYVSPFSPLTAAFDFHLRLPDERLVVRINEYEGDRLLLHSVLAGRRRPLTDATLAGFALKYPLLSLTVMARIHLQALHLYLKKVPYFRKAADPSRQTALWRPHSSIHSPDRPHKSKP